MPMKRFLLISLLALLAFTACRQKSDVDVQEPELGVYLEIPSPRASTRAGDIPASAAEYAVNDILLWIFKSAEPHELIGSLSLSGSDLPLPGKSRRYSFRVDRDFVRDLPPVDVFAIANTASVGCTLTTDSPWADVKDAFFGDPYFGLASLTSAVPATGLPMTDAHLSQDIVGEAPELKVQNNLKLERIVSKLRIVFCRMEDDDPVNPDVVSIDRVTLSDGIIPSKEYLFTENAYGVPLDAVYNASTVDIPVPAGPLAINNDPSSLTFVSGMDAVTYENAIQAAVDAGKLTDFGVYYLRESDRPVNGKIEYTINGVKCETPRSFRMVDGDIFSRNHSWTVYGYFLKNRNMQLSLRALPWDYGRWKIDYSKEAIEASQLGIDGSSVNISTSWSGKVCTVRIGSGGTAILKCSVRAPEGGTLMINPEGEADYFLVTPETASIPTGSDFTITVRKRPGVADATGKSITLSFSVDLSNREIDANTEITNNDIYRFVL